MMKKKLATTLALVMGLSVLSAASAVTVSAEETELNIFMWGDYISEDLIAAFEEANGCKVNLSYMSEPIWNL